MKKILLIEDNRDVRETTTDILELSGYEVIAVDNGRAGVEKAVTYRPDLIICDIMMPGLDGYGVLHILGKRPETVGIPFIFLTARSEKADVRKGMNLGADDYLTKPFEEMELLDAIETRLRKSALLREEYAPDATGLNQFFQEARTFEDLKDLSSERKVKIYKKKSSLFSEGSASQWLYFINKGQVKTYKTSEDGKELVTGILGAGDFLGYMALLDNTQGYAETATALQETEVSLIPPADFFRLLYGNRDVASKFIKMLSRNLIEREEQLLQIAYHSVRQRVAEALLKLAIRDPKTNAMPVIKIAHKDLAGITGSVKETVTRTLADFKEEGLIHLDRMKITILDEERLLKATF
ncbi:MAG: response regulator [Cyclobacteriaceae bacterium]